MSKNHEKAHQLPRAPMDILTFLLMSNQLAKACKKLEPASLFDIFMLEKRR